MVRRTLYVVYRLVVQPSITRVRIVFYLRQKYSFLLWLQDFGKDFALLVKNRSKSERGAKTKNSILSRMTSYVRFYLRHLF